MSLDDEIRVALENAGATLARHLDADFRAIAAKVSSVAAKEREVAVAAAAAAASVQVRAKAEAQVSQLRALAQKHAEDLKRAAEAQIGDLRRTLAALQTQTKTDIETARREAQQSVEEARTDAAHARLAADNATSVSQARIEQAAEQAQIELARVRAESDAAVAAAHARADEVARASDIEMANVREEVTRAKSDLDAALALIDQLQGDVEKARLEASTAQTEANRLRDDLEHLAVSSRTKMDEAMASAEREIASVRRSMEEAHANAEQAVESARAEARNSVDATRAETERLRAEAQELVERARAEADAALEALRADAANERSHAEEASTTARARIEELMALSERAATESMQRASDEHRHADGVRCARLAESVRTLDGSESLSEVLERLTQCAGQEVERAALFLVKGERVAGWRFAGFGDSIPPARLVELDVVGSGIVGDAVRHGVVATAQSDSSSDPRPLAFREGEWQAAMALPVRVGGEVVAVLYADTGADGAADTRWASTLDVLTRHASRVLEAMTIQQVTGLPIVQPTPDDKSYAAFLGGRP